MNFSQPKNLAQPRPRVANALQKAQKLGVKLEVQPTGEYIAIKTEDSIYQTSVKNMLFFQSQRDDSFGNPAFYGLINTSFYNEDVKPFTIPSYLLLWGKDKVYFKIDFEYLKENSFDVYNEVKNLLSEKVVSVCSLSDIVLQPFQPTFKDYKKFATPK